MSTERETTRVVRSWLEAGVTRLPDRVLDAVLDQLPATPQHRPWWPARRTPMTLYVKLALGAAALLVVAIGGISILPRTPAPVGPSNPLPTPTTAPPSASPGRELRAMNVGNDLAAGRYFVGPSTFQKPFSITLPEQWTVRGLTNASAEFGAFGTNGSPYFGVFRIEAVYGDPCHPEAGYGATTPKGLGSLSVDDVERAFSTLKDFQHSPVTSVQVDGIAARHLTISNAINTQEGSSSGCTDAPWLALFDKVGGERIATVGQTARSSGSSTSAGTRLARSS